MNSSKTQRASCDFQKKAIAVSILNREIFIRWLKIEFATVIKIIMMSTYYFEVNILRAVGRFFLILPSIASRMSEARSFLAGLIPRMKHPADSTSSRLLVDTACEDLSNAIHSAIRNLRSAY